MYVCTASIMVIKEFKNPDEFKEMLIVNIANFLSLSFCYIAITSSYIIHVVNLALKFPFIIVQSTKIANQEYEAIRTKRCELFMAAFDHIQSEIEEVYKVCMCGQMHVWIDAWMERCTCG
jgi:hypothetical protein